MAIPETTASKRWTRLNSDVCLGVFVDAANAWQLEIPAQGQVLEVGCAEADWLAVAHAHEPSAHLIGVDVRSCRRDHGTVIKGDIFEQSFGEQSFDAIVLVSALEHIGLGHYKDPVVERGDLKLMDLLFQWLKPGGWLYADVPWTAFEPFVHNTAYRAYDDLQILTLWKDGPKQRWYTKSATPIGYTQAVESCPPKPGFHYIANLWRG